MIQTGSAAVPHRKACTRFLPLKICLLGHNHKRFREIEARTFLHQDEFRKAAPQPQTRAIHFQ